MSTQQGEPSTVIPLGVFSPRGDAPFRLQADMLSPLAGTIEEELRPLVAGYLRSGTVILALMSYTEDVLEGRFGVDGGSGVLTDGRYYWRRDAAEYVLEYGVAVDEGAVAYMRDNDWTVPDLSPERVAAIDSFLVGQLRRR